VHAGASFGGRVRKNSRRHKKEAGACVLYRKVVSLKGGAGRGLNVETITHAGPKDYAAAAATNL